MWNSVDLTGFVFGKLLVIGRYSNNKRGEARWECMCQCGKTSYPTTNALKSGNSTSCGCTRTEKLNKFSAKHNGRRRGKSTDRLYYVWRDIIGRCTDENIPSYANYGARGITVCNEWLNDYSSFRDWAMRNGYDPNAPSGECTVDRINNNDGYFPENCRFVSRRIQANNKRNNHFLVVNGERITAAEASEKYGIPYRRLMNRLNRGWTDEEAVLTEKRVNQWG